LKSRSIISAVVFSFCFSVLNAQEYRVLDSLYTEKFNMVIYASEVDTLVYTTWAAVVVEDTAPNRKKKEKYDRLQAKVVKVYPYAKAAGDIMNQCDAQMALITDKKSQNELIDRAEEELKLQFENELRKLTISEGIILIKLINRQTGETSFELVQDLKGKFSAFMWQSVARLFGHNLKDDYDAAGDDLWIENIVGRIETGDIPVTLFQVDPFLGSHYSRK